MLSNNHISCGYFIFRPRSYSTSMLITF